MIDWWFDQVYAYPFYACAAESCPWGEPAMDNFGMWSNFAQIVWRDSRMVGCAMGSCGAYWVCHYGESITRTKSKQASKQASSLARMHASFASFGIPSHPHCTTFFLTFLSLFG